MILISLADVLFLGWMPCRARRWICRWTYHSSWLSLQLTSKNIYLMLLLGEHAIIIQPNWLEQDSKRMIYGCRRWCGSQRMAPETTLRLYRGADDRLRCHILSIGEGSWVYWGQRVRLYSLYWAESEDGRCCFCGYPVKIFKSVFWDRSLKVQLAPWPISFLISSAAVR